MKPRKISERIHEMNRKNTCDAACKNDMWKSVCLRNNFHHFTTLISVRNIIKTSIKEIMHDKRMV